jgi:hypothetical protein
MGAHMKADLQPETSRQKDDLARVASKFKWPGDFPASSRPIVYEALRKKPGKAPDL